MSRIGLSAVLLILISATAVSACCFFKCCFKSSSANVVTLEDKRVAFQITSVDSQMPVQNNIPNAVDHPQEDIVVESSFDPSSANPELTVLDDGQGTAVTTGAPKPPKKYKPIKIVKKPPPKTTAAPAPVPSPAPAPIPVPDPPGTVWQTIYSVDLEPGHKYRAYATAGQMTTPTVTFRTKP